MVVGLNWRIFPVIILSVAFLVSLVSLALFPWNLAPAPWSIATVVFSVLTGFSVILVAYSVYDDRDYSDWTYARALRVENTFDKRITRLEEIVGLTTLEKAEKNARASAPKNPYYSDSARERLGMRGEIKEKKQP